MHYNHRNYIFLGNQDLAKKVAILFLCMHVRGFMRVIVSTNFFSVLRCNF